MVDDFNRYVTHNSFRTPSEAIMHQRWYGDRHILIKWIKRPALRTWRSDIEIFIGKIWNSPQVSRDVSERSILVGCGIVLRGEQIEEIVSKEEEGQEDRRLGTKTSPLF